MFDVDIDFDIPSLLQYLPLSADSIELLTQIYDDHVYELVGLIVVLLSVVLLRFGYLSGYSGALLNGERKSVNKSKSGIGRIGIGNSIGIGKGFTGKTGFNFKMPAASPATVCLFCYVLSVLFFTVDHICTAL